MKNSFRTGRITLIALMALGAAAGDALALDPYVTVLNGGGVSVGGSDPWGNGFGTGADIVGVVEPGSWVAPASLGQWYNFAATGNEHGIAAGSDSTYVTAAMSAEVAPAGSGVAALAVNHAQFDIWVGDNPDHFGRGGGGKVESQSSFSTAQTQFYGALHWQVISIPEANIDPGVVVKLDMNLLYQAQYLELGPTGTSSGDFTAGPFPRREGSYDTNISFSAGAGLDGYWFHDHGGGRYLIDVWWAFSDAPIDPALLTPTPEPQTWALMLAGLLGVAQVARRRKSSDDACRNGQPSLPVRAT